MTSIQDERILLEIEESLLQVSPFLTPIIFEFGIGLLKVNGLSSSAEDGSVDINGNPPLKHKTGNWKACPFILGNECRCERLAYYGIAKNLITYYTSELHVSNVSAASQVMIWQGTCFITPLIGAVIADSYWGRYWTIASFSAIYFLGMASLTLSASVPGLKPEECVSVLALCPPATTLQYSVFFSGLYLIALGTGGIKPCVSSFGADQFDDTDPSERVRKASFFNWFYFSINIGSFVSSTLLVWVQENSGWGLGFLIPTVFMGLRTLHRQLLRRNSALSVSETRRQPGYSGLPSSCSIIPKTFIESSISVQVSRQSWVISEDESKSDAFVTSWKRCTVTQVEEVKILIRMFPIWASGIVFSALYSQISTLFVQQGRSMDRIIHSFEIPPASLGVFDTVALLISVPVYDRCLVPFVRRFTGKPKGITDLQRMGIGLFLSVLSIAAAATVETVRLQFARDSVSMSIFWQIPQYKLMGIAEVFFFIGQLGFFYEQSPDAMRSLCSALALLSTAVGSYLSQGRTHIEKGDHLTYHIIKFKKFKLEH
ncbi:unnamed protein product [Thlaspi arvense]|uniref:Uncharacterized protein n=1 Tax=Thlaspi arvense TaxID=13288 RepID=A0AAU9RQX5_THLAR|nr:unnamed protein product [Thlaspi arvense]